MIDILSFLLTQILVYGYPIIAIAIIVGYTGIPVPVNALVLASGSFVSDGTLNIFILGPIIILTSTICDCIGYYIGYKYGYKVINKFFGKGILGGLSTKTFDKFIGKYGFWTIFLTRWLFTPLTIPVNIIVGARKYPIRKFLIIANIGQTIWAVIYIYLGYLFGANWQSINDYLNRSPMILTLVIIGIICIIAGWGYFKPKKSLIEDSL